MIERKYPVISEVAMSVSLKNEIDAAWAFYKNKFDAAEQLKYRAVATSTQNKVNALVDGNILLVHPMADSVNFAGGMFVGTASETFWSTICKDLPDMVDQRSNYAVAFRYNHEPADVAVNDGFVVLIGRESTSESQNVKIVAIDEGFPPEEQSLVQGLANRIVLAAFTEPSTVHWQ